MINTFVQKKGGERPVLRIANQKGIWMCWCGNDRPRDAGFYSVNRWGEPEKLLWGRGDWYACRKCGRVIERKTLRVVGWTKYHRLSAKEMYGIFLFMNEEEQRNWMTPYRGATPIRWTRPVYKRDTRPLLVKFAVLCVRLGVRAIRNARKAKQIETASYYMNPSPEAQKWYPLLRKMEMSKALTFPF